MGFRVQSVTKESFSFYQKNCILSYVVIKCRNDDNIQNKYKS